MLPWLFLSKYSCRCWCHGRTEGIIIVQQQPVSCHLSMVSCPITIHQKRIDFSINGFQRFLFAKNITKINIKGLDITRWGEDMCFYVRVTREIYLGSFKTYKQFCNRLCVSIYAMITCKTTLTLQRSPIYVVQQCFANIGLQALWFSKCTEANVSVTVH